ncbi:hypothetical protein [Neptunomonas qingdaonensis]|nr:hypothetical protein [Neptunomonas qingdaonensis]
MMGIISIVANIYANAIQINVSAPLLEMPNDSNCVVTADRHFN